MTAEGGSRSDAPANGVTPALTVRDVTVRARSRTLLDGVGLEAVSGDVVAVVGPNGAGKTTLLEVIAGVRGADRGTVTLGGASVRRFSERARRVAFLPDRGELPSELRVRDVVGHALRFRPRPSGLVHDLRTMLAIEALLDAPVGVLSRGEHQRVALFCVLAVDRAVVVLDEPFGAFDPWRLRDVLAAVRRVAESGAAVVATVHHLGDSAQIADRALLLADGRMVAWGTLASLRDEARVPGGSLEDVFLGLLSRSPHAS